MRTQATNQVGFTDRRRGAPHRRRTGHRHAGHGLALAAFGIGLLYTAVSAYWGLGGRWLLETIGGSLERGGRAGDPGVLLAVWAAVALKAGAAGLPLLALRRWARPGLLRTVRVLAWIEAALLSVYGLIWSAVGLLIQAGVIRTTASDNHRALAWHAYLWDPWFLLWGLLVATALLRIGRHPGDAASQR